MKTKITTACFLVLLGISMNAQSNNEDIALTEQNMMFNVVVAENEEDAIKKTIIEETSHYFERDMFGWKNCFVDSETTTIIWKLPNGKLLTFVGMTEMESNARKAWIENPDMDFKIKDRLQWHIRINGTVAWVNFKQKAIINGTEHSSEEIRVLVKEDDTWKIALESSIF